MRRIFYDRMKRYCPATHRRTLDHVLLICRLHWAHTGEHYDPHHGHWIVFNEQESS